MKIPCAAFVLLVQTLQCLASDDSPFQLQNKATGNCLVKLHGYCYEMRWTTSNRLLIHWKNKCLGVQGKSVGSEITLYDCDETSELQKWECRNETLLALKDQDLYVEQKADNIAVLSKTIGTNSHFTISGSSSGACSRTYRELYTIEGNAHGRPCMFPFFYKDQWISGCTSIDNSQGRKWCAVETKYDNQLWGYCPTNTRENWTKHITTGAYYQLNTEAAVTWSQAETSCKQQGASLLSITDPHEQAYVTALLHTAGRGKGNIWIGLILDPEHGWQWSSGSPYRYLNWDSGHPLPDPGHSCGMAAGDVQFSWQSSTCTKKLGYICYSKGIVARPTEPVQTGFCSAPWIPYNGHCFHLRRTQKTWIDAQRECRKEEGDLVSIRNVEDQSFVISQLGYASTDELWIGLNDKKTEGLFDFSDHSTVSFTSWEFGKPAMSTDQEDCVLIRGENGNWADRVCDEKHGFICMKTSASKPSGHEVEQNIGCKTGWKRHGSYCYLVGTETKTFDEAKHVCKSSGSYLADVSNGVDNAFLVSLVGLRPEKHFWLGLSNQKNIDVFVWTNRDTVTFTHWNAEMPGHHQGCVAMTTGVFAGLWDVLPCTNKEKYICKHLADGAALTPAPPTLPSPTCADGWTPGASSKQCYKVFTEPSFNEATWFEARDYCRAIGGDLLSIHSMAELTVHHGYRTAWIGLSAPDPVTGYVWSDKSPVNFQHWENGEPNNKNNVESCVEFKQYKWDRDGSWNDVQCEKYNSWICQIRAGVTPKPPPAPITPDYNMTSDGWLEWKGNQYFIKTTSMAMEEARKFCKESHSDLVTINSEAEAVFLWKQISKRHVHAWIGLTVELDGTFSWMDGSPVVFQKWAEGQPDFKNYDENCAFMEASTGFWHDNNCGRECWPICKRSGSPPANATVIPTEALKGGCPPSWKKFNSKCYSIVKDQQDTWYGARDQCQAMGGNLVSIPSRHVEVFLVTQMAVAPITDLWIGLRSLEYDELYWTDGQPRPYVNLGFQDAFFIPSFFHHRPDLIMLLRRYHYRYQPKKKCITINTNPSFVIGKWTTKSCNDTNGFICHRNVDPSFPDSPESTTPVDYVKVLNNSIKVITQEKNWDEARKHCEDDGATLASLRNEWIHLYVELLALNLKVPLWIGLNKAQTNNYFRFIAGWHMTFSHWDENEPSRDRPCVYVDVDGKWKTADCNQTMNSVCMKSTDVPPTELSDFPGVCPEDPDTSYRGLNFFWLPFKGYCYIFFTEEENWADASASCVRHGGTLASIEDPSEQEFIERNAKIFKDSHTAFWIGLFKTQRGEWLWLDRTVMDYTNWAKSQPVDRSHGEISTSDGTWRAAKEYYSRSYICKTPKVLLPTLSPPPPPPPPAVTSVLRGHIALMVVLVITGISILAASAFFLIKKSAHLLPIPDTLRTFENPLFFSNGQAKPDTSKLIENTETENPYLL